MKRTLAVVLLCGLGITLSAWAQVDTATVTGTVRDSTGALLPNVTVTATETNTGIKTTVKSKYLLYLLFDSNRGRSLITKSNV
jgi:hypothetical protein